MRKDRSRVCPAATLSEVRGWVATSAGNGPGRRLRELLAGPGIVVAPGAYDALTARLVEAAGFPAVYLSGAGVSYSMLARRDVGLVTMTEMVQRLAWIAHAVQVPVIADADTGYGGPDNVRRTVREYERAGAAALQIEDQDFPKRCGHLEGKRVVPVEEMVARLEIALEARQSADTVIIARTDARSVEGWDAALERAARYAEAGADVIFVEAPLSEEELAQIPRAVPKPVMANMVEGGKTPLVPTEKLAEMGFRLVIYPNSLTRLLVGSGQRLLADLREQGTTAGWRDRMADFAALNRLLEQPWELGTPRGDKTGGAL